MIQYVTGTAIKFLREKKGHTQRQLAGLLTVSDEVVSKWETQRGLPDISLLEPLVKAPEVSVAEFLLGEQVINNDRFGNMLRTCIYVCPVCGNVIHSLGQGSFTRYGITLPVQEMEEVDEAYGACVQQVENEYYVMLRHPVEKDHFISFLALITPDQIRTEKLYPEQNPEARFAITGAGMLYAYCNQHDLFRVSVSPKGGTSWR